MITQKIINELPTGRAAMSFAQLVPGVNPGLIDVGGGQSDKLSAANASVNGSKGAETPQLYDGTRWNNMNGNAGGSHQFWAMNAGVIEEFVVETGSTSAERMSAAFART